jgi:hypothetical protein
MAGRWKGRRRGRRAALHRAAATVGSGAFLIWVGIHAVANQRPTHPWYDLVLYSVIGGGLLLWVATTDRAAALGNRLFGETAGHGVSATVRQGRFMAIEISVDGPSMRDAGVTLTAPEACRPLWRLGDDGKPRGSVRREVMAQLEAGGPLVRAIQWHEKGLHLLGGGHSTQYSFIASAEPGDYPIRLRVYDDSDDGIRDADLFLKAEFRRPTPDPKRRAQALDAHRGRLVRNRAAILAALASGHYWIAGHQTLATQHNPRQWPDFDASGADARLCELLGDAYEESTRLVELVDERGGDEPAVLSSDHAERALVAVNLALIVLDSTLSYGE